MADAQPNFANEPHPRNVGAASYTLGQVSDKGAALLSPVGQGILLVQEHADEEGVDA